jgi:type III secretion protein N (ATPase)
MIFRSVGYVVRTHGEMIFAVLPRASVGMGVVMDCASGKRISGSVTAVERAHAAIAPFADVSGIAVGDRVASSSIAHLGVLGFPALGRVLDAACVPMDGRGPLRGNRVSIARAAMLPCDRGLPSAPFWTGVRVIDGLLTIARGARVGVFGAPGAGKTTLLEMILKGSRADAVVLSLIGERGREAAGWMRGVDRRTSIVCATSDRSAAERSRAAEVACAQAVTLRERGLHVLLIVDNLARYCAALREQRTALGEPVGRGGYPPSVFAELARFLERAGASTRGSVTMVAGVLSDGADEREPVSDAARSLLDGHIVLSVSSARAGRYPAVDVLASASRTMRAVVDAEHARHAGLVRSMLSLLESTREARALGLGGDADARLTRAIAAQSRLERFLEQSAPSSPKETLEALRALSEACS